MTRYIICAMFLGWAVASPATPSSFSCATVSAVQNGDQVRASIGGAAASLILTGLGISSPTQPTAVSLLFDRSLCSMLDDKALDCETSGSNSGAVLSYPDGTVELTAFSLRSYGDLNLMRVMFDVTSATGHASGVAAFCHR